MVEPDVAADFQWFAGDGDGPLRRKARARVVVADPALAEVEHARRFRTRRAIRDGRPRLAQGERHRSAFEARSQAMCRWHGSDLPLLLLEIEPVDDVRRGNAGG